MTISESDPRVFFASERTLLAWVRTGITIIGLGFIVSRFGLFMSLMVHQSSQWALGTHHSLSGLLGVAFVFIGALAIAVATIQHQRFVATLAPQDLPYAYSTRISVLLAVTVSALGVALSAYLFVTTP